MTVAVLTNMSPHLSHRANRSKLAKICAGVVCVGGFVVTIISITRTSLAFDNRDDISVVATPLLTAARVWRQSNPQGCPTIGGLIHDGAIAEDAERHDPWGGAYRLVCLDVGGFSLISPGRDGQLGTDDDLEFPRH